MNMAPSKMHWLWIPLFVALAVAGATFQSVPLLYTLIFAICICVGLIAFDKIPHKLYLPIIFSMSLALLYQTTLMSPGLVGTDIHADYYFAYWTKTTGTWHWAFPSEYNTSFSSAIFAPFISWAFHIPLEWVFKAIYPILLALVPPLLYLLYKNHVSKQVAFLACFFFVAIPTYMIELVGIPKQQVAEFFFVLCIFLILSEKFKLKWKPLWIALSAVLFVLCHYSIFAIGLVYFAGAAVILLILRVFGRKIELGLKMKYLLPVVLGIAIIGGAYFSIVAEGRVWNSFTGTYSSMVKRINPPDTPTASTPTPVPTPTPAVTPTPAPATTPTPVPTPAATVMPSTPIPVTPVPVVTPKPTSEPAGKPFYLKRQGPIVKAAIGLDFFDVSATGKVFRILQFTTQVLVLAGIYRVIRTKGKGWSKAYLAFGIMACVILLLTVFYPGFSPIMNATRFYSLALIFLAPAIIIGGLWIFKKVGGIRTFTLAILIPYFLFTSGFVFEATKNTTIEYLDTPYSIALSGNRVEVGGVMTLNDTRVRNYIVDGSYYPVYADIYGTYLTFEKHDSPKDVPEMTIYNLYKRSMIKDDAYLFLRERNTENQEITFWLGVGLRTTRTYEEIKMELYLEGREVIYQCGNAMLLSPKTEVK